MPLRINFRLFVALLAVCGYTAVSSSTAYACDCAPNVATPCEAVTRAAQLADGSSPEYKESVLYRSGDSLYFVALVEITSETPSENTSDAVYEFQLLEVFAGKEPNDSIRLKREEVGNCGEFFDFEPGDTVLVMGSGSEDLVPTWCSEFYSAYAVEGDDVFYTSNFRETEVVSLAELRTSACQATSSTFDVRALHESNYTLAPTLASQTILLGTTRAGVRPSPRVSIFDATGKKVLQPVLGTVDISMLPPGSYVVLFRDEEGVFAGRFVKQ